VAAKDVFLEEISALMLCHFYPAFNPFSLDSWEIKVAKNFSPPYSTLPHLPCYKQCHVLYQSFYHTPLSHLKMDTFPTLYLLYHSTSVPLPFCLRHDSATYLTVTLAIWFMKYPSIILSLQLFINKSNTATYR
jgi:hypothetical protein